MNEAVAATPEDASEEWFLTAERFIQFMQIWTVYRDHMSGRYKPSVGDDDEKMGTPYQMRTALLFIVYSFFYSLIEQDEISINAFRIWRVRFPDELAVIDAVEQQAAPMRDNLRLFRNRLGFHGSRTAAHRERGFELFAEHSGTTMWNVIVNFKSLGATLFAKDMAASKGDNVALARVRSELDAIRQRALRAIRESASPAPPASSA